jgi:hypothetical protein
MLQYQETANFSYSLLRIPQYLSKNRIGRLFAWNPKLIFAFDKQEALLLSVLALESSNEVELKWRNPTAPRLRRIN